MKISIEAGANLAYLAFYNATKRLCQTPIFVLNLANVTTILQTVSGLLRSKTGSVEFLGENLGSVPPHKVVNKGLAHVPEGRRIFQQMTVRENLEMGGFTRPAEEIGETMEDMFKRFPRLKEREWQLAGTLSGGEQQRAAIARALMIGAELILADEPTGNLDLKSSRDTCRMLKEIGQKRKAAILMVTHDPVVASNAGKVHFLRDGKIVSSFETKGDPALVSKLYLEAYK